MPITFDNIIPFVQSKKQLFKEVAYIMIQSCLYQEDKEHIF